MRNVHVHCQLTGSAQGCDSEEISVSKFGTFHSSHYEAEVSILDRRKFTCQSVVFFILPSDVHCFICVMLSFSDTSLHRESFLNVYFAEFYYLKIKSYFIGC
jgi:hypothetical protein